MWKALSIQIDYDRTDLMVGDSVTATATVVNNMANAARMVILDLPIPAGFNIDTTELEQPVQAGTIAKYQVNPRSAVVYVRGLEPRNAVGLAVQFGSHNAGEAHRAASQRV